MVKILILTSGNVSKLDEFKKFDDVAVGSFKDVNYDSESNELRFKSDDLRIYKLIYFRMIGKSLEIATLVADYCFFYNIKIIDEMYTNSNLMPVSLGKSIEMRKLSEAGIKIPRTVFGGELNKLPFPFIVKSTSGQKAREVWLVNNQEELDKLKKEKFVKGKHYFTQELIANANRIRALVVGDKVIGAIKRQGKWNKDHTKITLDPIPNEVKELALNSAKAVGLNICGVDIIINSVTNEMYIIEANAAPAWKLINKYCGVSVEDEIVKYIQTKV